jgi:hypothetical protein
MTKRSRRKKKSASDSSEEVSESVPPEFGADFDAKEFRERFPHLAKELETKRSPVHIEGVRWEETERTQQVGVPGQPRFAGYSPDIIDFLRRCTTEKEALEIINYLEKRQEIDSKHAAALRRQLQEQGLRSFGSKKKWGHYERESKS